MNTQWPQGIITTELDQLEALIFENKHADFEQKLKEYLKHETDLERRDYATLLQLEYAAHNKTSIALSSEPFPAMLARRGGNNRVVDVYTRLLLVSRDIAAAKALIEQGARSCLSRVEELFLNGLVHSAEGKDEAWYAAMREILAEDPYHRGAIGQIAARELNTDRCFGALAYLASYIEREPLDVLMRACYLGLLLKNGQRDLIPDEKAILEFLDPNAQLARS